MKFVTLNGKNYFCKRTRILEFLISKKVLPKLSRPDPEDNKRMIWVFEIDDALISALKSYYEDRSGKEVVVIQYE